MNSIIKIGLTLLTSSALFASCVGPLAFQDPASARQSLAPQGQHRFGSRPLMNPEESYAPQNAGYGLQQAAQPQMQPQMQQGAPSNNMASAGQAQRRPSAQPAMGDNSALMGWNGEVSASSGEGQRRMASGQPKHGLEPQVQGRMHILNLYQEVLDERDSLLIELQRLNSALREGEQLLTQLRASEKEYGLRLSSLEEVKRTLVAQNRELSSRLTLAQIRRLESDKLLLETQIAMHTNAPKGTPEDGADPMLVTEK